MSGTNEQSDVWWKHRARLEDALEHGLKEQEFNDIVEVLGRDLNMVEVGICAALYSEHCSYKSTKVHLKNLPTEGPRVIEGPGENAGVIDIGDNQAVVFKIESHNHPTFIEPFQGAATGVGGILRDVFTMGARPLALMNALRFGNKEEIRTPYLLSQAVKGIGTYGNCMGIPTVGGELFFHKAYNGNCLVNAFALGLVEHDQIFRGNASGVGNTIYYVGSKTGRDGIHGATMASEEFNEDSEEKRPTVQVGDPFQEKLLLEACLEAMKTGAIEGIQDMGAAGMTSSTYEMAERAGTGVVVHLDRVPQREVGMNPYEIMLSESQERMLVVVKAGRENEIEDVFAHWELDAVHIGEVVEGQNVDLYWNGELVSSMAVSLVTSSVPQYRWPEEEPELFTERRAFDVLSLDEPKDLSAVWLNLLGNSNLCSRREVFDQYDSTVRSNTVIHPGGDAAVIRIKAPDGKTQKGVAMTVDCNSRYCEADPRHGAALSVAESYRNITAVGATPLGISDCLNFGSPEKPNGMWQIAEGIRGLGEASRAFEAPIVSGNVSLYNETSGQAILPTPMVAMVGLIADASLCVPAHFQNDGDVIFVLGATDGSEIGASEYLATHFGIERGAPPSLNYELERKTANLVRDLIANQQLVSCHDISAGGLAVAFADACLGVYHTRGATLTPLSYSGRNDGLLFSESGARYILSCKKEVADSVREKISQAGLKLTAEGVVGGNEISIEGVATLTLEAATQAFRSGLNGLFH
ncbi:MAG: phosphoribosylformylglycinamidine synthase subunit PurL [Bdellovibrionales bacterium]|nr:phosphoribosylformylglycinamidine synthase subunit PurL [Bdellovibrionales bacterium]